MLKWLPAKHVLNYKIPKHTKTRHTSPLGHKPISQEWLWDSGNPLSRHQTYWIHAIFSVVTTDTLQDLYVRNASSLFIFFFFFRTPRETFCRVIWLFLASSRYVLFFNRVKVSHLTLERSSNWGSCFEDNKVVYPYRSLRIVLVTISPHVMLSLKWSWIFTVNQIAFVMECKLIITLALTMPLLPQNAKWSGCIDSKKEADWQCGSVAVPCSILLLVTLSRISQLCWRLKCSLPMFFIIAISFYSLTLSY